MVPLKQSSITGTVSVVIRNNRSGESLTAQTTVSVSEMQSKARPT
jgi:hypothetical protein